MRVWAFKHLTSGVRKVVAFLLDAHNTDVVGVVEDAESDVCTEYGKLGVELIQLSRIVRGVCSRADEGTEDVVGREELMSSGGSLSLNVEGLNPLELCMIASTEGMHHVRRSDAIHPRFVAAALPLEGAAAAFRRSLTAVTAGAWHGTGYRGWGQCCSPTNFNF